ncbi:TonB-dependent receptor plug domain-containing protein, partial [Desulfobulbus rhabdoformis]|uniref:TonB-dependent receptor plug domain-containing protein n=1 Tax=Desulfobulbus rhabdoformis TaxID=34032 RepID=UPI0019665FFE
MQTVEQQVSSPIKKYPFSKIVFTVASSITLAGLLFPSQGAAEEQVDLKSIVITSTMIDQDVETAPGTVDIIDKKEISRLGAENISDVLHQAAGVTFSTGAGRSNEVSIRGMGSGHTLILLDGRRISGSYNATVDVNQIPIVLVYARHGRELMGCKSPVRRIQSLPFGSDTKVLADGKGVSARRG